MFYCLPFLVSESANAKKLAHKRIILFLYQTESKTVLK